VTARLEQPETWTRPLRQVIGRAAATDPEVERAVTAFLARVHGVLEPD
jgi:hypothetical protein